MGTKSIERQLGAQLRSGGSTSYKVKLLSLLLSRLQLEAVNLKSKLDEAVDLDRIMFAAIYGTQASRYYVMLREIKALEDEIKSLS